MKTDETQTDPSHAAQNVNPLVDLRVLDLAPIDR